MLKFRWNKNIISGFIIAVACLLTADAAAQTKQLSPEINFDKNAVAASVGPIKITAEEFYQSYEFGPAFIKKIKDSKEKHLEYMINEKLLALDGYSRSVDTSGEVSSLVRDFEGDLASEEMFKNEILPLANPPDSEVNKIIAYKQVEVELKWIYSPGDSGMNAIVKALRKGSSFDSLFALQLNDSVFTDERTLKTTLYQLGNKNPQLAAIVDSLKPGQISLPIHTGDGWYIVKLVNLITNSVTTESELNKLKQEANNAAFKFTMDRISDQYVNKLIFDQAPVIKRSPFNIVRSYLGTFLLTKKKYEEWQLRKKLDEALANINNDVSGAALVTLRNDSVTAAEFLSWFRNRSQYIKLNENDLKDFSVSLENLIWRMLRDKLLAQAAEEKGYGKSAEVVKQLSWWRDKIVGSFVRNEIANSVVLQQQEVTADTSAQTSDILNRQFQAKLLHKILSLQQKYKIVINKNVVNTIKVSDENNPKAIEMYAVKKGGLIPRTPYPTINNEWINWE